MIRSESVAKLMPALLKARAECSPILKDRVNPAFRSKYADLAAIYEAVVPALSANGLVLSQPTAWRDGVLMVETIVIHAASGEFWGAEYPAVPVKSDPQGLGSATTYARRYGLCALLGIAADDDDDGNAASQRHNGHPVQERRPEPPRQAPPANPGYREWLEITAERKGIHAQQLHNHLAKVLCKEAEMSPEGKAAVLRGKYASPDGRRELIAEAAKYDPARKPAAVAADSDPDMP